ncbi:MAG: hypothetical protein JXR58_04360 [Bacteroidales bacterium]|nr:hypothetical protein [Bacteroidales bacterium]
MNKVLLFVFLLCSIIGLAQDRIVSSDQLEEKSDVMYVIGEDSPYTGKSFTKYKTGEKGMAGNYVNGLKDGDWVWWYQNGTKKKFVQYSKGVKNGQTVYWYKNGQKKSEMIFENDKNIKQMCWDENGNRIPNPTLEQFR